MARFRIWIAARPSITHAWSDMLSKSFEAAARRLLVPTTATIELLSSCNLRCLHCYVTHTKKTALTFPILIDLLDQLATAGTMVLTLTGGEIGLRRDLYDIIAAARERHFQVKLLSSGTRWTQPDWDRIAALGVEAVRFSLYGSRSEIHEAVTQNQGSFDKTLASALGLKARGVFVGFACPVMHLNAHDVGNLLELAAKYDIPVQITPDISRTDANATTPLKTLATFEQLVAMYGDARVKASFWQDNPCSAPDPTLKPCGVGDRSVFVQSTGDVLPCASWPVAAGNILETPILEIFRSSEVFKHARGLTYGAMTRCAGCVDAGSCHPCAAINLQEHGRIDIPAQSICSSTAARNATFHGASTSRPYEQQM